jgi:hypothetical protein
LEQEALKGTTCTSKHIVYHYGLTLPALVAQIVLVGTLT